MADRRDALLKMRPTPWEKLKDTLHESTKLVSNAKDARLRRIARLAQMPLIWDLGDVGAWVHTICGPYPPYVGQTGGITQHRSLLETYEEHLQKAKSLKNQYTGLRHRKI